MTPKIVGFEGPSLAGKTTLIGALESRLRARGLAVLPIEEYTIAAGGHERFPPLLTADPEGSLRSVRFFLDLETQRFRQVCEWLSIQPPKAVPIILVDRLILSCMAIRRAVHDDVGYHAYLTALRDREVIMPDVTCFVELNCSEEERSRRLVGRTLFDNWETLYDPPGYLDLLREIDSTVVPLNLKVVKSDDVAGVEQLILALD